MEHERHGPYSAAMRGTRRQPGQDSGEAPSIGGYPTSLSTGPPPDRRPVDGKPVLSDVPPLWHWLVAVTIASGIGVIVYIAY